MPQPLSQKKLKLAPLTSHVSWVDMDDRTLLEQISTANTSAMSEFISRYYNCMKNFALRYLGEIHDAEDIAQETFVRVWAKADTWRFKQIEPKYWLYRICYNLCIDEIRSKHRSSLLKNDVAENIDTDSELPENIVYQAEKHNQLINAMQELSSGQRAAIIMCNFHGMSNKDAANVLDVSVEAIESLLSRGRKKLRKLLLETKG